MLECSTLLKTGCVTFKELQIQHLEALWHIKEVLSDQVCQFPLGSEFIAFSLSLI
jgi:hypothetical protein